MLKRLCVLLVPMMLGVAASVQATPIGYQFDLTTFYIFGCSADNAVGNQLGPCGAPDTGYLTARNNGLSTFIGTMTLDNDGGTDFPAVSFTGTLAPGTQKTFSLTNESSNYGGFGPLGVIFSMNGTVQLGVNSEAVSLSIHDANIHSGFSRLSPCDQTVTDAFVLQGGSPRGCDNGDDFEVSQAPGHAQFFEAPNAAVPEPMSLVLLGSGLAASVWRRRRAKD